MDLIWQDYRLRTCESDEEKAHCRDFSFTIMQSQHYGLRDTSYLEPQLYDVQKYTYFSAHTNEQSILAATLRLDFQYDLTRFSGLDTEVIEMSKSGRLAEGGYYRSDSATHKERVHLFTGLFAFAVHSCRSREVDAIYAQIREPDVTKFQRMGWEISGLPFEANGWSHTWVPLIVRLDTIPFRYIDFEFQQEWARHTGVKIDTKFWSTVLTIVDRVNAS